jgi:hypothetical protein
MDTLKPKGQDQLRNPLKYPSNSILPLPSYFPIGPLQFYTHTVYNNTVTRLVTVDGVLDWQLDLLQSYSQVQYNWISPVSLRLTIHDWIYHNNSAAIVTAATLVTGELQVPFLPFPGYQLTQPPTQKLFNNSHSQLRTPRYMTSGRTVEETVLLALVV